MSSVAYACPQDDPDPVSAPIWFPVLTGDGWIPVAEDANGSTVFVPLCNSSRVWSGVITGNTGTGKSVSAMAVMLPGVAAGVETVLLADGHRGVGFPALRPVVSHYGRSPAQWSRLIEIAYRVMQARMERRSAAGLRGWATAGETDPILTLVLNEAAVINPELSGRNVRQVYEILALGGLVGVRVIQITWSLAGVDIVGGVSGRDLMVNGWAICHRSGPAGAVLARPHVADIDLRDLADGQAAVMIGGTAAPSPSQMRHISYEAVAHLLTSVVARHLQGEDGVAAGPEYNAAHWDDWSRTQVTRGPEGGDR